MEETGPSRLDSLTYAFQQLNGAVRSLATGHGVLSQRLHHAWTEYVMHVRPGELPESMRRSTEYIMETLRDPGTDEGQQSDLAAEIVTLYTEIVQALERERPKDAR